MEKVFCGNCKYWRCWWVNIQGGFYRSCCVYGGNIHEVDRVSPFSERLVQELISKESEINKNNDCMWYERTWWKFWV